MHIIVEEVMTYPPILRQSYYQFVSKLSLIISNMTWFGIIMLLFMVEGITELIWYQFKRKDKINLYHKCTYIQQVKLEHDNSFPPFHNFFNMEKTTARSSYNISRATEPTADLQ